MTELKPCPFCGVKPFDARKFHHPKIACINILCRVNPRIQHIPPNGSADTATSTWNARAAIIVASDVADSTRDALAHAMDEVRRVAENYAPSNQLSVEILQIVRPILKQIWVAS